MGKPLFYEVMEKPATSCIIGICTTIWFYIQKKNIGYQHVGVSYETAIEGHYWRLITSAFSHISVIHLVFNMSALWSLGIYHILIQRFKIEYFRRVTAVGYSCVVFGWMTILSVKQPSSKLDLFGLISLPISFAPFESLIFTSIIVPQASFLGHLSGIIVGLKRSGAYDFNFLEIESVTDPSLPSVRFMGNSRTLQMSSVPLGGIEIVLNVEFYWPCYSNSGASLDYGCD
ncbi:hypothetical protein GOBAR_DD15777 [Gossypium barbadense]|nr:hypothetical protein GOBAR_DD15777 [Gossypium barbadense]